MNKIALITLSAIAISVIASCTMRTLDRVKTESAVKHYLDTLWKGTKVDIRGFADFGTMKDMWEEEKKWAYQESERMFKKKYPKMSENDRNQLKKSNDDYYAEKINYYKGGYRITCYYNLDFKKYEGTFWVYNDFKKVQREMLITLLQKRDRNNHLYVTNAAMPLTLFQK